MNFGLERVFSDLDTDQWIGLTLGAWGAWTGQVHPALGGSYLAFCQASGLIRHMRRGDSI